MEMDERISWTYDHISKIKSGGYWIVPRSFAIYKIDHEKKQATVMGDRSDAAVDEVFRAMGWMK